MSKRVPVVGMARTSSARSRKTRGRTSSDPAGQSLLSAFAFSHFAVCIAWRFGGSCSFRLSSRISLSVELFRDLGSPYQQRNLQAKKAESA